MNLKEAGQKAGVYASGAVGLTAGVLALKAVDKMVPATAPAWVKKLAPGLAGMAIGLIASMQLPTDGFKGKAGQAASLGVGLAGAADVLKKFLGGVDATAGIASNMPTLSGMPINTGDYPPSYYKENTFQGVPMQGVPMQGVNPNVLSGNAMFDLQGVNPNLLSGVNPNLLGYGNRFMQ